MDKEEIKDYLKRIDELGTKLTGEDKETYTWLIYGCNQCAKLLNETEQQCKKQKEFINYLENMLDDENDIFSVVRVKEVLQKYKEMIGGKDERK